MTHKLFLYLSQIRKFTYLKYIFFNFLHEKGKIFIFKPKIVPTLTTKCLNIPITFVAQPILNVKSGRRFQVTVEVIRVLVKIQNIPFFEIVKFIKNFDVSSGFLYF